MEPQIEPSVAIWRDLLIAALIASLTLGAWVIVFTWFGDSSRFDSGFVTFLGGVLAISGLLFRQYMLKEVLDYLKSWDKMSALLQTIIVIASKKGHATDPHMQQFVLQEQQARQYSHYVRSELVIIPIVPMVLILLYGCAFLSDKSIVVRECCLFLMIHLVAYLGMAAVTSTRLACAHPDLEKTLADLQELQNDLQRDQ